LWCKEKFKKKKKTFFFCFATFSVLYWHFPKKSKVSDLYFPFHHKPIIVNSRSKKGGKIQFPDLVKSRNQLHFTKQSKIQKFYPPFFSWGTKQIEQKTQAQDGKTIKRKEIKRSGQKKKKNLKRRKRRGRRVVVLKVLKTSRLKPSSIFRKHSVAVIRRWVLSLMMRSLPSHSVVHITHTPLSLSVFIYVNKAGEIVDLFTFSLSLSLGEIRK
jgi:hypothetical protein